MLPQGRAETRLIGGTVRIAQEDMALAACYCPTANRDRRTCCAQRHDVAKQPPAYAYRKLFRHPKRITW